jgi:hypothetical protein
LFIKTFHRFTPSQPAGDCSSLRSCRNHLTRHT